jgi:hypothetical protein
MVTDLGVRHLWNITMLRGKKNGIDLMSWMDRECE